MNGDFSLVRPVASVIVQEGLGGNTLVRIAIQL